ncbi:MAG: putative carboxypeptidase [Candidatus Xenobia bacterium]
MSLPLRPGARVAVVSPSGPPDRKKLEQNAELIASWGFEPVLPPERRELYFAGSDQERLQELQRALQDPAIDLVWASRGGYGTARLLGQLDPGNHPRPVVGFSDLTVLHQALHRKGWTELVHGPVLHSLGHHPDEESRRALKSLLTEDTVPDLAGRTVVAGQAEGPLVGGNLCVLASLCGTPFQLSARDSILLLEDVHEKPYRLDRYLVQLRESGCLDGVLAVALGSFEDCAPSADEPWSAEEVLEPILRGLGVPLVFGLPVGHGAANLPFLYGARYRLQDGCLSPANRPR